MANIVELREMSSEKIEEMLEDAREEMFNLRFRKATAQLEDVVALRHVRREIAQLETVLNMRWLAQETAAEHPEVAAALADKEWEADASFDYEASAWVVTFRDGDNELATATVDLNRKQAKGRKARVANKQPQLIKSYKIG